MCEDAVRECFNKNKYEVFVDIDGMKHQGDGTIPPKISVTSDRPDIVVINNETKNATIFELTVPYEPNIEERHILKQNKYCHVETDSGEYSTKIIAIEVGSRGYVSKDNEKRLRSLHSFYKSEVSFKRFRNCLSSLAVTSSYYLFITRTITKGKSQAY